MPLGIARLNTLSLETTHPAIGVSAAAATGLAMVDPNGDYVLEDESYSAGESAVDTMTFAFWMRFDASATSGEKYIFKFEQGTSQVFALYNYGTGGGQVSSNGFVRFGALVSGSWKFDMILDVGNIHGDGNLHHVAIQKNSTTFNIYVDGVEKTSNANTFNSVNQSGNHIRWDLYDEAYILSSSDSSSSNNVQNPITQLWIDHVSHDLDITGIRNAFYNGGALNMGSDGTGTGLPQPMHYFEGNTTGFRNDGGSSSRSWTLVGSGVTDISSNDGPQFVSIPGLRALDRQSLRSGDSAITTQPGSSTGEVTVSFWFKFDSGDTGNIIPFNLNDGNQSGTGGPALMFVEMHKGRYRFGCRDSGNNFRCDFVYSENGNSPESSFGSGLFDGDYHHFVVSCTTSDPGIEFYVDGVNKSSSFTELAGRITAGNRSNFDAYDNFNLLIQWNQAGDNGGHLTQLWIDDSAVDLSTNLDKFYNNGPVEMGPFGTASGLSQPLIFHTGDTTDFFHKGGDTSQFNYTINKTGSGSDVSANNGPQFS